MKTIGKKTVILFAFLWIVGCGQQKLPRTVYPLHLGETPVHVVVYGKVPQPWLFFNMHDDENTAVEAGLAVIQEQGGLLVTLAHSGKRLITFQLNQNTYAVDPNRIFTPVGIRKTLEKYSQFSEPAFGAVQTFSRQILNILKLDSLKWMITLHNNGEESYSIRSYMPGGEYERDASAYHVNPQMDVDDFYFVTDSTLFLALKARNMNVVLQNNAGVTDDGSLSVYCGKHGIAYVNVEAQHGHLKEQQEMIQLLLQEIQSQ